MKKGLCFNHALSSKYVLNAYDEAQCRGWNGSIPYQPIVVYIDGYAYVADPEKPFDDVDPKMLANAVVLWVPVYNWSNSFEGSIHECDDGEHWMLAHTDYTRPEYLAGPLSYEELVEALSDWDDYCHVRDEDLENALRVSHDSRPPTTVYHTYESLNN